MKQIFTHAKIGKLKVKNRIIQSGVLEMMADETGEVRDEYIHHYKRLAVGNVGLIITGGMFVDIRGKGYKYQTGIHNNNMVPALKNMTDVVHENDGHICFQLIHGGSLASPKYAGGSFPEVTDLTEADIQHVLSAFVASAKRAVAAGADAIQIHAAHGALISQFLSPFFNKRTDEWGGSAESQFRFLREVVKQCQDAIKGQVPIIVKINCDDFTPEPGVTAELASSYAKWLAELGVAALEVSGGTSQFSFMNMVRGKVPVDSLIVNLPDDQKGATQEILESMVGHFEVEESFHLEKAKIIGQKTQAMKLILVGGNRELNAMEKLVTSGNTDFVSIGRPFVREPGWVKRAQAKKVSSFSCNSCNECLAAVINEQVLKCNQR